MVFDDEEATVPPPALPVAADVGDGPAADRPVLSLGIGVPDYSNTFYYEQ